MLLVLHSGIRPHGIDPDKLTHGHTVRYRIRNPSHNSNEIHPKYAVERCVISVHLTYIVIIPLTPGSSSLIAIFINL